MAEATKLIELYDPPQCCPGGACDPQAVEVAATLHEALERLAEAFEGRVDIRRYVFPRDLKRVRDEAQRRRLAGWQEGKLLPVTCVDGAVAKTADYPSYDELVAMMEATPA